MKVLEKISKNSKEKLELHGSNPISSTERVHILDRAFVKDQIRKKAEAQRAAAIQESVGIYSNLHEKLQDMNDQSKNLLFEVKELKAILSKSSVFASAAQTNLQALRWENRELSQFEVELLACYILIVSKS